MGRNGVADTTSPLNIGEEYQTSERMVNVLFVYIVNCYGQPLMPCQPRKARVLLKQGKDYQQGPQLGFCNVRAYVLAR